MSGTAHEADHDDPPAAVAAQSRLVAAETRHDDTTLRFEGRMAVNDEDCGGDPYNHTGKFRRTVR